MTVYTITSNVETWKNVLRYIGISTNGFGIGCSILVLITVSRSDFLQYQTTFLIAHQAAVNLLVCLVALLRLALFQNPLNTGSEGLDKFLCYIWQSEWIFWWLVYVSVVTFILLAINTYMAIGNSAAYNDFGVRPYVYSHIVGYILAIVWNSVYLCDTVTFVNGVCYMGQEVYGKTIGLLTPAAAKPIAVVTFVVIYFVPYCILVFFYSMTIKAYSVIRFGRNSPTSRARRMLLGELMKAGMAIAVLFILSTLADTAYTLQQLFQEDVPLTVMNSPVNRIGSLLLSMHAFSSLMYFVMMRAFRAHLITTLTFGKINTENQTVYPMSIVVQAPAVMSDNDVRSSKGDLAKGEK